MIITYNIKPTLFSDLGSFSKVRINHKLKCEIAKTYQIEILIQPSRPKMLSYWQHNMCCQKNLPGPDVHFCFMKN